MSIKTLGRAVELVSLGLLAVGATIATGCTSTDKDLGSEASDAGAFPLPKPERPGCAQDKYVEQLPTNASLSGLAFSEAGANDFILGALGLRYPMGKTIVEGGLSSSFAQTQGNCIDRFLVDRATIQSVLREAPTVVHECGHFYDLGESSGSQATYVVRPNELRFTCVGGDTTNRAGKTFARNLIKQDAHYAKRVDCVPNTTTKYCDPYSPIYLSGSATDRKFDSGDQGYAALLEEATQYANSLVTALAFKDQLTGVKVSARDGILTFLWYLERYFAMARTDYPEVYAFLSEDSCWRQATLSVWDRGWFYLRLTDGSNLGRFDAEIEPLVNEPALKAEIDALRILECK